MKTILALSFLFCFFGCSLNTANTDPMIVVGTEYVDGVNTIYRIVCSGMIRSSRWDSNKRVYFYTKKKFTVGDTVELIKFVSAGH